MNARPETPIAENRSDVAAGTVKRSATVVISLLLIAAILFLAGGHLDWAWAWVYLGIYLVSLLINASIMLRTSPETVAERARPQDTKDWDKFIGGFWGVAIYLVLPLVAGLDVRFRWTQAVAPSWHIAGAAVLAAGLGFTSWAMIANAFFSTAVRIQTDRGHKVCSAGPYRLVRHPGYVGFILQSIAVPFLLGSAWALIPGIVAAVLMIVRTALEDQTLQSELPGYSDYVQKVRYRLIPGIW